MLCTHTACRFLRELLSNCTNSRHGLRDGIPTSASTVAADVQEMSSLQRLKLREGWYSSGEVESLPQAPIPQEEIRWPLTNRDGQGIRCKRPRRRSRPRRQSRWKNLLRSV